MALILSSASIELGQVIKAGHVTQSIKALTGTEAYNITISGSLTIIGPNNITGSINVSENLTVQGTITAGELELTNITINGIADMNTANIDSGSISGSFYGNLSGSAATASYVTSSNVFGPNGANSILTSSYAITSSYSTTALTSSNSISSSYVLTSSYSLLALTSSNSISSSYTQNSISSSYALTASYSETNIVNTRPTYRATINQVGTDAPVATSGYIDTMGIVWQYLGFGTYNIQTTASSFPEGKTRVLLTNGNAALPYFLTSQRIDNNNMYITTFDVNAMGLDNILQNATIIIEIDP